MPNITPTAGWDAVPLLQTIDRNLGGNPADTEAVQKTAPFNRQASALANQVEAIRQGMLTGPANCALSGPAAGIGAFSGTTLTITGATTPIIIGYSQGVSDFGHRHLVHKITSATTFDFSSTLGEFLIVAEYSAGTTTFSRYPVTTTMLYQVSDTAPATIAATQFYFNTSTQKMYKEIGGSWQVANAAVIGGVTSLGDGTRQFHPYPYGHSPTNPACPPIGTVSVWHDSTPAPAGYLLCEGQIVRAVKYPLLFNAIKTAFPPAPGNIEYITIPDFSGNLIGSIPVSYMIRAY
jgi:Phage Tail Collar Domain